MNVDGKFVLLSAGKVFSVVVCQVNSVEVYFRFRFQIHCSHTHKPV